MCGLAYFIARERGTRGVEVRGEQVVVRVQRRVRMGMKDELSPPYILSSSPGHMTIYLYLFGSLHFLICPFWVYPVLSGLNSLMTYFASEDEGLRGMYWNE